MSRERVMKEYHASIAAGSPTDWFHKIYEAAQNDGANVPWDDHAPNAWLVKWLPEVSVKADARVLDVACGLGDNAEFLSSQGFTVTGADLSPVAIKLAGERFPDSRVTYEVADFLQPPAHYQGAFDLVSEVYTLQALPESHRLSLLRGIASCVAPGGKLLIVARRLPEGGVKKTTPPFQLTREFTDELITMGFTNDFWHAIDDTLEDQPIHRLVACYSRSA